MAEGGVSSVLHRFHLCVSKWASVDVTAKKVKRERGPMSIRFTLWLSVWDLSGVGLSKAACAHLEAG